MAADAGVGRAVPATVTTPALTVVVPSVNGADYLFDCLGRLREASRGIGRMEVVVVDRLGGRLRSDVQTRFPEARLLPVDPGTSIPAMRAIGVREATGDAVAMIEDHVLVPPDWATRMLQALAGGRDVVGGSVTNAAVATTVDWAAFLCEYSQMLAPRAGDGVDALAGNNVVYRRALLERYDRVLAEERWEDRLHGAMREDGITLTCRPEITVGHRMHYRVGDYLSQRYLYSRAYAGLRRAGMSRPRRVLFAVGAVALPPVLFARIVTAVVASQRHLSELVRSLPLLVVFVCSWAVGEAVGYAAGPGDALSRVR